MLAIWIIILSILVLILALYITFLQLQMRSVNKQLTKRLSEHTRQPLSLELFNKELNSLAVNINKCLKAEENLRLESFREEKQFKEMVSNISHDLRTPLTAIKGYQQLMEREPLSDNQKNKLQIAQKYANELGILIEHFFEYSYLVNSNPDLNLQRINLTNLVVECLAESIPIFEANKLSVHFEDTPPIFVLADKEMVIRIIQNLILNCIQHSESDIEVSLLITKNAAISFKNFVKNPSDIDVTRIFDRFYTTDRARKKNTGLGLSIVELLAKQMGGNVSAFLEDGYLDIRVELPLDKKA